MSQMKSNETIAVEICENIIQRLRIAAHNSIISQGLGVYIEPQDTSGTLVNQIKIALDQIRKNTINDCERVALTNQFTFANNMTKTRHNATCRQIAKAIKGLDGK